MKNLWIPDDVHAALMHRKADTGKEIKLIAAELLRKALKIPERKKP